MELLQAFNIAVLIVAALGGWLLRVLFDRINKLETADLQAAKELAAIREALPTNYVRRDDFKDYMDEIFGALRRIEDKLERKADRP